MSMKWHSGSPLWWVGVATLVAATPASAQHVLRGRVTDTTNVGLPGVEVVLPALKQTATTDAEGYYRIVGIPDGPRRIVMRKIGFQPLNSLHTLIADTVVLDVRMAPQEVVLPTIEVTAGGWRRFRPSSGGGRNGGSGARAPSSTIRFSGRTNTGVSRMFCDG